MKDLIIIAGAPGSGKTTIAKLLKEKLDSPYIDFGWLREFHLDHEWKKANDIEEKMSFENLVSILKNYTSYNYENVIVTDLLDKRVEEIPELFKNNKYIIISLLIDSDEELKKRVIGERDSGFKNAEAAIEWNNELKNRGTLANEHKIDNSHNDPNKTVAKIIELIN